MKKLLAIILLLTVLAATIPWQPVQVKAERECENYVVAELDWVDIFDDKELFDLGELEIACVVVTRSGKQQASAWPRTVEDSSWQEMHVDENNPVDHIDINMPILSLKESDIGGEVAVIIMLWDNDEANIPEWLQVIWDTLVKMGDAVSKVWTDPSLKIAVGVAKLAELMFDTLIPNKMQQLGIHTKIIQASDWAVGTPSFGETQDDFRVQYHFEKVKAPTPSQPMEVKLTKIIGHDWGGLPTNTDSTSGNAFIQTRVYDSMTMPNALVQMRDFGPETQAGGYNWTLNEQIFTSDAVGPFLYVEIGVWNERLAANDRVLGLYSRTFYPDENWGTQTDVKRTYVQRFNIGLGNSQMESGDIEIEFEIRRGPVSEVEVVVTPEAGEYSETPGSMKTYAVEIRNLGTARENFTWTVKGLDNSWYEWLGGTKVELSPSDSWIAWLLVTPPREWSTTLGSHAFSVEAKSASGASDSDDTDITILPFYDVRVTLPENNMTTKAGQKTTYTVGVKNLGNIKATYLLTVDCLDFDASWATLWPKVMWDLQPGQTGAGWLQVDVPVGWTETSTCNFKVKASLADTGKQVVIEDEANGNFTTVPLEPGEKGLTVKIAGELDYLFMENIKIRISALATDIPTSKPIPNLKINITIYYPDNTIWKSETMTEIDDTGIYEWQSDETLLRLMRGSRAELKKGIYIIHVKTSAHGNTAHDIAELHLDPPAEQENPLSQYLLIVMVGAALTGAIFIAKKWKSPLRKPVTSKT